MYRVLGGKRSAAELDWGVWPSALLVDCVW